jgi:sugar lactone lactonase YvrE
MSDVSQFIQMQRLRSISARQPIRGDKSITHLFQRQMLSSGITEFLPNPKTKNTDAATIRRQYVPGIQTKYKIPGRNAWGIIIPQPVVDLIAVLYAGTPGSSGNNSNQFTTPEDVYADTSGNLWVVEGGVRTIRTFSTATGLISTLSSLSGNVNGIVPYSGGFLVSDSTNSSILQVSSGGVVTTFGSGLGLSTPIKLAIDSTYLYIVDRGNYVVKRVLLSSPTSSTNIIGSGVYEPPGFGSNDYLTPTNALSAPMGQIQGVCIDSFGKIYITESSANRILKYDPVSGNIILFAGNNSKSTGANSGLVNGPAFTARFNTPIGITIDNNNNLYVADSANFVIRKITPSGVVSTVNTPTLQGPNSVYCDKVSNILYITDTAGSAIYKMRL